MNPRAWLSGASGSPPSAPGSPSIGYPRDTLAGVSPPTNPGAFWFYQLAEELRNVQVAGGITPSTGDLTQLLQALNAMFMHVVLDSGVPCGIKAGNVKMLFKQATFADVPTGVPGSSVSVTRPDGGFATNCLFALVTFEANAGDNTNWQAAVVSKSTSGCTVQIQESFNVSNAGTLVVMAFGW